MDTLVIHMPDDLLADLHKVCQRRGVKMSDTVLEMIRNYVKISEQQRIGAAEE